MQVQIVSLRASKILRHSWSWSWSVLPCLALRRTFVLQKDRFQSVVRAPLASEYWMTLRPQFHLRCALLLPSDLLKSCSCQVFLCIYFHQKAMVCNLCFFCFFRRIDSNHQCHYLKKTREMPLLKGPAKNRPQILILGRVDEICRVREENYQSVNRLNW